MAGQFSYLQFLRRVPTELLVKYFASKNIDLGIDFKKLGKKKKENIIFQAITSLPADQQTMIETEFQDINAMACEGGITSLTEEACFHDNTDFIESISTIDGFHAKAMWAFLEQNDYWRAAAMLLHASNISTYYWRPLINLPQQSLHIEKDDIVQLEKEIGNFFHKKEGRGRNCKIEVYRRHNKEYFFAYPEDFWQSETEWVGHNLRTRPYHPAFEIIFVYCGDKGFLDIYAPKNGKVIPELQKMFAKTILKIDVLDNNVTNNAIYDLEPLADPNFEFKIDSNSGITSAAINVFRLTRKRGSKQRIIVEEDTSKNPKAIYDFLKEINLSLYYITKVSIKVTFEPQKGKRTNTRTFNISHPNYCNLNHDGRDEIIRNMLIKSGVEPR